MELLVQVLYHQFIGESDTDQAIETNSDRQEALPRQLHEASKTIQRLRIVKDIPNEYFEKKTAQVKASDLLTAIVNLIGQQLCHFAILKNRTKAEQKFG
jgi:hypothetical protein